MSALKDRIQADLKTAMLGGEKFLAEVLRGVKSAILYEEVAKNKRNEGLDDAEIEQVLAREAKKRQERAELCKHGGKQESAEKELKKKDIISNYLHKQLSDQELQDLIKSTVQGLGENAQMGQVIGAVKA